MKMPEMPPIDPKDAIPYASIRYVAGYTADQLRAFALQYAESVREACARLCEEKSRGWIACGPTVNWEFRAHGAEECAAAIRHKEE